ncbi:hypothetical protein WJX73_003488 [Symbiochloris irregularis]|uniref:Plastid lipid-associated protein/fibrillin conserved domain-containing protein n=1 Tax=Symbiochloris irregularis TaxID=706552 RepID=A0AAW1Q1M6_9CHLO
MRLLSSQALLCTQSGLQTGRLSVCVRCAALGTSSAQERKALKEKVIRATANTKRGKLAGPEQQAEILRLVLELEAASPTRDPATSDLINGRWSLLYTGPGREGDVDWEKRTGGVEGPVLSALKPLAANTVRSKGITQVIDAPQGKVQNIAEFSLVGVDGFLNVEGTVSPAIPAEKDKSEAVRVDVAFTAFVVKVGALPRLRIPLNWISPKGWVDTTYVDEEVRVGRGDKGSVFVTVRQQQQKRR